MGISEKYLPTGLSVDCLYTAFVNRYEPGYVFRGEQHEAWEMSCFLEGAGGITSGTEVYRCVAGDVVIHPPHRFHTFWTYEGKEASVLTVSFKGEGASRFVPKGKFVLMDGEKMLIDMLAGEIHKTYRGTLPGDCLRPAEDEQMIKGLLELLLLSLYRRRGETVRATQENGQEARLAEVMAYLESRVCEPLDVARICDGCHMGRSTLKELFHRYTGTGVMQYFNDLRVRHACRLIRDGCSMAEIARQMNFSSQNYFSAFFKREMGMSPMQYRHTRRNGAN